MSETTVGIIKPDAFRHRGEILEMIKRAGLVVKLAEERNLLSIQAGDFYKEHEGKPFYIQLINFMTSGPVVILLIEGVNAIQGWRKLMGSTNPKEAAHGTIRKSFGTSIERNAVHGSDSPDSAIRETSILFPQN